MRPRKKDRHLPPCVYLKHGSYWLVRGGKWTRLGKDLPTALQAYGKAYTRPTGSMPALIAQALAAHPKVAHATRKQYELAGRQLSEVFAEFLPEQITHRDIVEFRIAMFDRPNWCNRCITVLRVVFNYALEMGLVTMNPVLGINRLHEDERERLLTHDEIARIKRHAPPRLAVIIDLLYLTGQRVNDVLRIRNADLSDEGIYFKQQKTGKRLVVQWTPELRAAVTQAKTLCGNVRAFTLLHGRTGKAPDYRTTKNQWDEACAKAGVEGAQLRDLRAMSLTHAEMQGLDPTALAGHASEQMTKRYLRAKLVKSVSGPSFRQASKKAS